MLVLTIVFLVNILASSAQICKTPNGQTGECKPAYQCSALLSLFRPPRSEATTKFLHESYCGREGAFPKVCCPIGSSVAPNKMKLLPDFCGNTASNNIAGGKETDLDEFPWMVLLEYQGKRKRKVQCGGSLISKRYVLTAKHCIDKKLKLMAVRLGEHDVQTNPDCKSNFRNTECNQNVLIVGIEKTMPHPSDDIALLRLEQDIQFTDFIKPICLPLSINDEVYLGRKLEIAGWGITQKGVQSSVKLKTRIPVVSFSVCDYMQEITTLIKYSDDKVICAGGEEGMSSCSGDSGGPLMGTNRDKRRNLVWYVIGVVSSGPKTCGAKNHPKIYVRVSKYVDWIVENLEP